jgi:hypothetical protein
MGTPASITWGLGRLDMFVRGADNSLWHTWYTNRWSGWASLGAPPGGAASEPAAVAWSAGRIDVFVAGADGQLWHKSYASPTVYSLRLNTGVAVSHASGRSVAPNGTVTSSPALKGSLTHVLVCAGGGRYL